MAVALVWFAWDKFGTQQESEPVSSANPEQISSPEIASETPSAKTERSIAVLPFVAMSSGADDEYFADGLTEEILNSLAQLPELLITARTSSFHFKGRDIPVQEIAATLGVEHIVEGSVRRSGDRLRVTAQLVRAEDGFHLWSENYDSNSEDTIQVQEDIAVKIAVAMDVVMDEAKREAMKKAGLRNVEAFVNFQKANELFGEAHSDVDQIEYLRRANLLLESVMELVPTYVPAYTQHSDLYVHILLNSVAGDVMENVSAQDIADAQNNAIADMTMAAEHARNFTERNNIELDLAYMSGNWHSLQGSVERHLSATGCNDTQWAAGVIALYGLSERFATRSTEIRKCDPMWSHSWFDESRAYLWAGDKEEALRVAREGNKVAPGGWLGYALVRALIANGLFEEADYAITTYMRLRKDILGLKLMKSTAMGDKSTSDKLFAELYKDTQTTGFFKPIIYAWMGDRVNANRMAAEIDNHNFGSQALMLNIYWCACGAPWDLEVTPNFAANIEAAGMSWPPSSPIDFPLKGW
jgi:TolB-like protein